MEILNDLLDKVKSVNEGLQTGSIIRDVVIRFSDDILELQKIQLFEGKASSGEDIRPYYSEDLKPKGYFHSVEAAGRYSAWKQDGISYPYRAKRNPDAPNLYINGRFHDELGVQFAADTVAIVPTTPYSQQIVEKYGLQTFGLTNKNWMAIFIDGGAYDELMEDLVQKLYGK